YPSWMNRKGAVSGYFNIKDLYGLILSAARGEGLNEPISEVTFSETYGLHESVSGVIDLSSEANRRRMEEIDSPRKAVFKKGMKLVLNFRSGGIEEFTINGRQADPKEHKEEVRELLDELYYFKGRERMPEVVI
ncbi:MAG: hypothetical protein ACP5LW_02980, partial [Nitrososphaeria archaeon]